MFEIRNRFSLSLSKCVFQVELDKKKFVLVALFFLFKFYFFVYITPGQNEEGDLK